MEVLTTGAPFWELDKTNSQLMVKGQTQEQ